MALLSLLRRLAEIIECVSAFRRFGGPRAAPGGGGPIGPRIDLLGGFGSGAVEGPSLGSGGGGGGTALVGCGSASDKGACSTGSGGGGGSFCRTAYEELRIRLHENFISNR